MHRSVPLAVVAALLALLPVLPGVPVFWITLLNYVGLGALVAIGLVLLTGRRRADLVRPGGVLRLRRLHDGRADDGLRDLALAHAAGRSRADRDGRRRARSVDLAAVRTLSAARHAGLGHQPLLPLRQAGLSRAQRRHRRHPAVVDSRLSAPRRPRDLLRDLGLRARRRRADHEPARFASRTRDPHACAAAPSASRRSAPTPGVSSSSSSSTRRCWRPCRAGSTRISRGRSTRRPSGSTPASSTCSWPSSAVPATSGVRSSAPASSWPLKDVLQRLLPQLFGGEGNYEIIVFGAVVVLFLQFGRGGLWPLAVAAAAGARAGPVAGRRDRSSPDGELPSRGTPLLALDKVRKTFGGLVAVNDVSFSVKAGEIVGLIGPNGAGKSTTFNLVTGLTAAERGNGRAARARDQLGRHSRHRGARRRAHLPACQAAARHERTGQRGAWRSPARHKRFRCQPSAPRPGRGGAPHVGGCAAGRAGGARRGHA